MNTERTFWIVILMLLAGAIAGSTALVDGGEPAKDKDERPSVTNSVGMKLVLIHKGKFVMGSEELPSEKPPHKVSITREFYLATHHVTVGQFRVFVKDAGYRSEAESGKGAVGFSAAARWTDSNGAYNWKKPGFEQGEDHPVVCVSWNDAVAFCKWLSKKEGKTYRLPTEAEFEFACRAGTTTRFSSGDDDDSLKGVANLADLALKAKIDPKIIPWNAAPPGNKSGGIASFDDGHAFTSPVGKFKPNPWGLCDMHGNAWQWCADGILHRYKEGPREDPFVEPAGPDRAIRGGAWLFGPLRCRSANRVRRDASASFCYVGFRVARAAD